MKKILGISLVAAMAVTPMMAGATDVTLIPVTPAWSVDQFATTSYVKGAYNILGDHVNTKQDKLTAGENAVNTSVKTSATMAETADAASDTALATEKAVMTAIEAARTSASGDVGAISEQIGDTALGTEATTITGAISELNTALGEESTRAGEAEDALQEAINTNTAAIEVLNGDVNQTGSVDKKIADAISNVNTTTSGLDTRVESLETTVGDSEGGLVKGVADNAAAIDTLGNKQIKFVSSWATDEERVMKLSELPNAE